MKKNKINNLSINFAYITITLSLATCVFTGYTLEDNKYDYEETTIIFEEIPRDEINENINMEVLPRTHEFYELSLDEVEYSGMKLSNELEDYIRNLCDKYALEYNLDQEELFKNVLVIGDQESNGEWNTNGVVSGTNDYGQFQINVVNHKLIEDNLGYTADELLYDSKKNSEAAVWLVANIMSSDYCKSTADVYGMYNGWINWEKKKECVKYVDSCLSRNSEYFPTIGVVSKK